MKNYLLLLVSVFLISCNKPVYYVASDFTDSLFTAGIEGPMYNQIDKKIYLVNYKSEGTIGVVNEQGECNLFVSLPNGSVGNGIRFDSKGDMLIADYVSHSILKVDMKNREIKVYANDTSMNQPNDLAIMKNNIVFCSDPNWKIGNGKLWRVDTDGNTTLLMDNLGTTNGIELSPDNNYLYVNESIQRKIYRYEINPKGELLNKQLFIAFEDGGLDGMKCDQQGNLWVARYDKGCVIQIKPDGNLLREVKLKGMKPTNLTFGGENNKKVYVTMQDRGLIEVFEIE